MSDYANLIAHSFSTAQFEVPGDHDIAYGVYVLPIAWLNFFQPSDVVMVNGPTVDDDPDIENKCPSLFSSKSQSLSRFAAKKSKLKSLLPTCLHNQIDALENAVQAADGDYLQVILTDMDEYISDPIDTEIRLTNQIKAFESDDPIEREKWLGHLLPTSTGDFTLEEYSDDPELEVNSLVGHLPDAFAIPLPIRKRPEKPQVKTPWWKFW